MTSISDNGLKTNSNRIDTIDVAKGIGLILVIFGHFVTYGGSVSIIVFSFHMPLFFILSGYLLSNENIFKSWLRRFITITVCFVSFSVLALIITLLIPSWRSGFDAKSLFIEMLNMQPESIHVGQLWFLAALLWGISLFYLLHKLIKRNELLCLAICVFIAVDSAFISKSYIGFRIYFFFFKFLQGMFSLLFIEIGYLVKTYALIHKLMNVNKFILYIFATALMLLTIYLSQLNGQVNLLLFDHGNLFIYYFTSVLGSTSIIIYSCLIKGKIKKILIFYGKNSLALFAVHSLVLPLYARLLSMITNEPMIPRENISLPYSIIGTAFVLIIIVPVAYIYNHSIGKAIECIKQKADYLFKDKTIREA